MVTNTHGKLVGEASKCVMLNDKPLTPLPNARISGELGTLERQCDMKTKHYPAHHTTHPAHHTTHSTPHHTTHPAHPILTRQAGECGADPSAVDAGAPVTVLLPASVSMALYHPFLNRLGLIPCAQRKTT